MATKKRWIQAATARMKRKGTLGSFGKATTKKITGAKKRGGLAAKRAVFAANMKRIARNRMKR
jgi:hypothetical protein